MPQSDEATYPTTTGHVPIAAMIDAGPNDFRTPMVDLPGVTTDGTMQTCDSYRSRNKGEDDVNDDLTRRLGSLEDKVGALSVQVGKVTERLTHMPTNADLLKVVSGVQWKIIGSVAALAIGLIVKALWPHIAA